MSWSVIATNGANALLSVALYVVDCPTCGILHGIPELLKERRLEGGGSIYCPNGHNWHFIETEAARQRKRADSLAAQLGRSETARRAARDQAQAAERSAAAYRGVATKMRNKIANGVCPVPDCRRHFTDVQAHIASKHKDWAVKHPEVMA